MKVIVYRTYEIDINDNEIKSYKKEYKKYPDYHYNLGDKQEFLELYDEFNSNVTCISNEFEEKSYNEFLEKWNKM